MAFGGASHSRVVATLKIALPLMALALLSTLFLFSRTIDPTQAIPYADLDVEGLAREPRVSAPEYSGLTQDGAALSIRAETARTDPMQPGYLSGEDVETQVETPDGGRTDIRAARGEIDQAAGRMTLEGAVQIASSTGFTAESDRIDGALDQTWLESPGPVAAKGPLGTLDAGSMVIRQNPEDQTYVLVFNQGVRLVYQP